MAKQTNKKKSAKAAAHIPISRYSRKERLKKSNDVYRAIHLLVRKGGKYKPNTVSLKAHRIAKLALDACDKNTFPEKYRALWAGQDEFIRTSFITDMLENQLSVHLSAAEKDRVKQIVEHVSSFRFPTKWSGFNFTDGTTIADAKEMQHPTSPGTGIFNPAISSFSKAHGRLDEGRVKAVIDAAHVFLQPDATGTMKVKKGTSLDDVVKAMVIAAGTFTLNYFTAPAEAKNIDATADGEEKKAQTALREFFKDRLVELGADRQAPVKGDPDAYARGREFRPERATARSVSPRRGPKVDRAKAEKAYAVA